VAAAFAAGYVILAPPSLDLAAHLYRAHLFSQEGFGIWDNYWYGGHHIVGYSVLYPAISAALTPQLAAALAATGTAALFEPLARRHFGARALPGAVLFGAATAIDLYTGRLALAFGALPAVGAILALDGGAAAPACVLALVSALCSPVAALFTALAAAAPALAALISQRRLAPALPGAAVVVAALAPVGLLAIAFPEGGTEPFGVATLLPILAIAAVALLALPREALTLRAGVAVYAAATLVVFVVPSPIGSNIARLGTFMAAPLAALIWWRRRATLLAIVALPLLYIGWQAPVSDVATASGDPTTSAGYYRPLLSFLRAQAGGGRGPGNRSGSRSRSPARTGRPTGWRASSRSRVAGASAGHRRQLDLLRRAPDRRRLRGLAASQRHPFRRRLRRAAGLLGHGRGAADPRRAAVPAAGHALGPLARVRGRRSHADRPGRGQAHRDGARLTDARCALPGAAIVRVRFSPYWKLTGTHSPVGCVAPDGAYMRLTLRHAGAVRLVMSFSLARIRATSARCG